ncbi:MAG: TIGR00730 family Rossman fold protein [Desulfobacteraceae bacterium]
MRKDSKAKGEEIPLSFARGNGPIDESIDSLISLAGGMENGEIVRELIIAALKAGREGVSRGDLKLMNATLKEMRYTAKVFAPYREVRKVTVFGSARTRPEEPIYDLAKALGRDLARAGYMVITGGGAGIMQAANEGAGPSRSFGVNIRLPFEQKPNPVLDGLPTNINYKYFFNRKVAFVKEADAVVLFPGGFGTLDEAMEVLTLVQTGKREPMPIVLLDVPGGTYWETWRDFVEEELLARGAVSPSDFSLFTHVTSGEDALSHINLFYRRYHSMRFVGPHLVIRLKDFLNSKTLDRLNRDYADILTPGGEMSQSEALPQEEDEPGMLSLPRLLIPFNRKEYGRLRELIDALNQDQ